ncbi:MAG: ABC transporter ATP-binding protein [Tissierellia bacterium]|nr:ABC transporter ATP-binding protein [Tissierellia bacterium]
MDTIIKTENLGKKYKEKYALQGANLEIEKGEIFGIVGPNGAGKSTLLKLLSGITLPSEGRIELFGSDNLEKERKRMSSIVENPTLFKDMSAKDNLEYFRIQRGITDKSKIDDLLNVVGLGDVGRKPVKKFSVGMKQRLAIALSLLSNPEILILDEPTSGIDPKGIVEIRKLLQRINKEREVTILISSHILSEVENLANKIAIIAEGKIKEVISIEELNEDTGEYLIIKTSDNKKAAVVLEGALGIKKYEAKEKGQLFIYERADEVEAIVKALVDAGLGIREVTKKHQKLEEFYIETVERKGA